MLRRLTYSNRYIQDVIYIKNMKPQCSSLDHENGNVNIPLTSTETSTGEYVWYSSLNDSELSKPMIAIERGNYIVMIDPLSIIDAIPNSDRFLDIAVIGLQNKMIISATSTIDPKIIRELTLHSTPIVYLNDSIYFLKTYPQLNIKLIAWSSFHPLKKECLINSPYGELLEGSPH